MHFASFVLQLPELSSRILVCCIDKVVRLNCWQDYLDSVHLAKTKKDKNESHYELKLATNFQTSCPHCTYNTTATEGVEQGR